MALACTTPALNEAASDLQQKLTHKGLLAALVYVLCQANDMNCTPATLAAASECLRCSMTEKGLLAAAVYLICTGGTGGGGGGNTNTIALTDPVGNGTTTGDIWINSTSKLEWFWDGAAWQTLIGA